MINIRTIRKIQENGGLTLKNGKVITYKSGWQVADHGIEVTTAEEAIKAVRAMGVQELIGHGKHGDTDVASVVDMPVEVKVELVYFMHYLLEHRAVLGEPHLLVAFRHHFRQHRDFRGYAVGGFQLAGVGVHQVPATGALSNHHA